MLTINNVVSANTGKEVSRLGKLLYYFLLKDHKVEREGVFIAVGESKIAIASFRTDVCYLFGSHSEQEVGVLYDEIFVRTDEFGAKISIIFQK